MLQFFRGKVIKNEINQDKVAITPKVIAVAGQQGAGKNALCFHLQMLLGDDWHYASTSDTLIERFSVATDIPVTAIKANKQDYRARLIEYGNQLERIEPAFLMKLTLKPLLMDGKDKIIVESARRPSEKWYLQNFHTQMVLVKASRARRSKRRGSLVCESDPTEIELYTKLIADPETYLIDNDSDDPDHLKAEAERFTEFYKDRYWY